MEINFRREIMKFIKNLLRPIYRVFYSFIEKIVVKVLATRSHTIRTSVQFAVFNQVEGDYLEFGVFNGSTFVQAYQEFTDSRHSLQYFQTAHDHKPYQYLSSPIKFYAFDSFEGLPAPTGKDANEYTPEHWQQGAVSCSLEDFKKQLNKSQSESGRCDVGQRVVR